MLTVRITLPEVWEKLNPVICGKFPEIICELGMLRSRIYIPWGYELDSDQAGALCFQERFYNWIAVITEQEETRARRLVPRAGPGSQV